MALSTDAYQRQELRHLATSTDLSILRAIRFSLNFAFWVENLHSHLIERPIRGQFPRVYPLRRVEHAHREILNAPRFHFVPRVLFVRQCVKNRFEGLQRGWEGFPSRARHDGSCLVRKDRAVRELGRRVAARRLISDRLITCSLQPVPPYPGNLRVKTTGGWYPAVGLLQKRQSRYMKKLGIVHCQLVE